MPQEVQSDTFIQTNHQEHSYHQDSLLNYVLILGKGRSGTTWLAQIMNTYENCDYKDEPFLASKSTPYKQWKQDLPTADTVELRKRFAALCQKAHHGIDPPRFPDKTFRSQNQQLRCFLYGLGDRVNALKPLYEGMARPQIKPDTSILIKDVNFPNEVLPRLCEVLLPRLVVMVRNPFANIASYLKGVELNLFQKPKDNDVKRVQELIDMGTSDALRQYRDRLGDLSVVQFETIRWRIQVEPMVEFAQTYTPGLVVVYEDLCTDPHGKTAEIFDFVGWPLGQATHDFIDASVAGEKEPSKSSKSYYTVYRDPKVSMSKWKTQLSDDQKADIASVFRESPLAHLWSDLPL